MYTHTRTAPPQYFTQRWHVQIDPQSRRPVTLTDTSHQTLPLRYQRWRSILRLLMEKHATAYAKQHAKYKGDPITCRFIFALYPHKHRIVAIVSHTDASNHSEHIMNRIREQLNQMFSNKNLRQQTLNP